MGDDHQAGLELAVQFQHQFEHLAGVVAVGPLNLAVSFYLAFRLALRAQNINASHRGRIYAAIRHRLRHAPLSFLLPPRADTEPPPDASDDALANEGSAPSQGRPRG